MTNIISILLIFILSACKAEIPNINEFNIYADVIVKNELPFLIKPPNKETKKCFDDLIFLNNNFKIISNFSNFIYGINDNLFIDFELKRRYIINDAKLREDSIDIFSKCFFSEYTYCKSFLGLDLFEYKSSPKIFKGWNYKAKINSEIAIFEDINEKLLLLYNFKNKSSIKMLKESITIKNFGINSIPYSDEYDLIIKDSKIYFSTHNEKLKVFVDDRNPGTIYFHFANGKISSLTGIRYMIPSFECDYNNGICFILYTDNVPNTMNSTDIFPKKIKKTNRDDILIVYDYKNNKIRKEVKLNKINNYFTISYNLNFDYVFIINLKGSSIDIYKIKWKDCDVVERKIPHPG